MGSLIGAILSAVLGFFIQFLPLSPFVGMSVDETFDTGIGWLNWLVDLNGMVMLFGAMLALGIVYTCVRFIMNHITEFVGFASGD